MNFALLGDDLAAGPLIAAIAADPRQQLTHAALTTTLTSRLLQLSPSTRLCAEWDELLSAAEVEAVFVAGDSPEVLEAGRQLAAAGRPLIVLPLAGQGTTWVYELSLIRDDVGVTLVPLFENRVQPKLIQLRRMIAEGAVGSVLQISIDRELHQESDTRVAPLLSVADVEALLLPDVDILRFLGGEYSQVTALYSGTQAEMLSQATVTLAADGLPEALWTLKGTRERSCWRLTVTGETGRLTLAGAPRDHALELSLNGAPVPADPADSEFELGAALLTQTEAALSGKTVHPDWTDMTRALEICDGARRSVRRRRTIDLQFESTSERSQFKTQMTAAGCSLLSLTLLAVLFVLIAGTVLDPREAVEVRAEHAGAVFEVADFEPGSAKLTPAAQTRLKSLAGKMRGSTFPVLIEQPDAAGATELDRLRRRELIRELETASVPDAEHRTVMAPVEGRGFQFTMRIARMLVFVPLGLFLLLQLFLLIARPSSQPAKPAG